MLQTTVYFLPSIISFLWFFSFVLKVKNDRQKLFTWIQAANTYYFATYALYISPITDYKMMVVMDTVNVPLMLATQAMMVVYLAMLWKNVRLNHLQLLLLAPALMVGSIVNTFYFLIGFDKAALLTELLDKGEPLPEELNTSLYHVFEFFNNQFLCVVILIFVLILFYEIYQIIKRDSYPLGNTFRFFFKGAKTTPSRAIAILFIVNLICLMPLIILGRTCMMQNPLVGIVTTLILAAAIHCIAHIEYYSDNQKEITFYFLSHLKLGETNTIYVEKAAEVEPELENEHSVSHASARVRMIQKQLHHLLEEEKIYKDESITLNQLAERFGIGRTTLSQIINSQYGMPFRDLLNSYRIDAVKKYMMANPTATQEVIAYECGFKNASYLNAKFKDIVGETPLMWFNKQISEQKS